MGRLGLAGCLACVSGVCGQNGCATGGTVAEQSVGSGRPIPVQAEVLELHEPTRAVL